MKFVLALLLALVPLPAGASVRLPFDPSARIGGPFSPQRQADDLERAARRHDALAAAGVDVDWNRFIARCQHEAARTLLPSVAK